MTSQSLIHDASRKVSSANFIAQVLKFATSACLRFTRCLNQNLNSYSSTASLLGGIRTKDHQNWWQKKKLPDTNLSDSMVSQVADVSLLVEPLDPAGGGGLGVDQHEAVHSFWEISNVRFNSSVHERKSIRMGGWDNFFAIPTSCHKTEVWWLTYCLISSQNCT